MKLSAFLLVLILCQTYILRSKADIVYNSNNYDSGYEQWNPTQTTKEITYHTTPPTTTTSNTPCNTSPSLSSSSTDTTSTETKIKTTTHETTITTSTTKSTTTPETTTTMTPETTTSTTHETTTTTTPKKTTTTVSTVPPSPKPEPQEKIFYITDPATGNICLLLEGDISLKINYLRKDGKYCMKNFAIKKAEVDGSCFAVVKNNAKSTIQEMRMQWNPKSKSAEVSDLIVHPWILTWTFVMYPDYSSGNNQLKMVNIENVTLTLTPTSEVFPGIDNNTVYAQEIRKGSPVGYSVPEAVETRDSKKYSTWRLECKTPQETLLPLIKYTQPIRREANMLGAVHVPHTPVLDVRLNLASIKYSAFRSNDKSKKFDGDFYQCIADKNKHTVNITAAVLVPLIIIILGVAGAIVFWMHKRRQNAYNLMP